jgi:predicted RNase H-like nuclease (RuvC/YqgF family)
VITTAKGEDLMCAEATESPTHDPRYHSHLEAQLAQADERIKSHDSLVNRYTAEIDSLKARVSRLQPLADAATEHRHKADEAAAARKAIERKLTASENRILGLEEHLEQAEQKSARLEDELAAYDELNARVAKAESLSDLFAS